MACAVVTTWKDGLYSDNMRALIEALAVRELEARTRLGAPLPR